MKSILLIILIGLFAYSCNSTKDTLDTSQDTTAVVTENDTVKIANEEVEYEIIIIEPGFNTWVNSIARPRGYYDQSFLENRNRILVMEWNNRVMQPQIYDPSLYELQINYNSLVDYGYEVNYLLYNYFVYFQLKHKQRLSSFLPRI